MTLQHTRIMALATLIVFLPHCDIQQKTALTATGVLEERIRPLSDIQHVELHGIGTLHITQQKSGEFLRISADKALIPYIMVSIEDNTVRISQSFDRPIDISIPTPHFYLSIHDIASISGYGSTRITSQTPLRVDSLDVNGHGNTAIELTLFTKQLDVKGEGAANITLTGTTSEQHIALQGATIYTAQHLKSKFASIAALGAFKAFIWSTERLVGNISGSGTLFYKNNPIVHVTQSGHVTIKKLH